jgi:hypothetical protein
MASSGVRTLGNIAHQIKTIRTLNQIIFGLIKRGTGFRSVPEKYFSILSIMPFDLVVLADWGGVVVSALIFHKFRNFEGVKIFSPFYLANELHFLTASTPSLLNTSWTYFK